MEKYDKTEALRREIRALIVGSDAKDAIAALWAVATAVSIATYGQAGSVEALRDLADEIERDLMAPPSEVMQ